MKLLFAFLTNLLFLTASIAQTVPNPAWWSQGDPPPIDSSIIAASNKQPCNIGQAKWMVVSALNVLQTTHPQLATQIKADLVPVFDVDTELAAQRTSEWYAKQKQPLLIGQLKALAKPFYENLHTFDANWLLAQLDRNQTRHPSDATFIYPWKENNPTDGSNKSIANIGQLKAVFALDFQSLAPENPDTDPDTDPDNDGYTTAEEFILGTNPLIPNPEHKADTDDDGIQDGWERLIISISETDIFINIEDLNSNNISTTGVYAQFGPVRIFETSNPDGILPDNHNSYGNAGSSNSQGVLQAFGVAKLQYRKISITGYASVTVSGNGGGSSGGGVTTNYDPVTNGDPENEDNITDISAMKSALANAAFSLAGEYNSDRWNDGGASLSCREVDDRREEESSNFNPDGSIGSADVYVLVDEYSGEKAEFRIIEDPIVEGRVQPVKAFLFKEAEDGIITLAHTFTIPVGETVSEPFPVEHGSCGEDGANYNYFTIELRVRQDQGHAGPHGSAAMYSTEQPDNGQPWGELFSLWGNEEAYVTIGGILGDLIDGGDLAANSVKWSAPGIAPAANQKEYRVVWNTTGLKEVDVEVGGQQFIVRFNIPDTGPWKLRDDALKNHVGINNWRLCGALGLKARNNVILLSGQDPETGDTKQDAIRHSTWNLLSAAAIGKASTIDVTTANEHTGRLSQAAFASNTTMDLFNNDRRATEGARLHRPGGTQVDTLAAIKHMRLIYEAGDLRAWTPPGNSVNNHFHMIRKSDQKTIFAP